ncbi:hypothetical protein WN51_07569 [Melipona quadrifasciata]|uniref:Uncharacterized protein n=1 Tax=Melipona quadrifasciata TaxID=166423 RepID=A0A0N0U6S4_9HYME|nr:hypothetical protein WN51_07569 [Melipona quadrifasciata]
MAGAQRGDWKGEGGWPGLEIGRKMNRAKGRGWKQCPEGVHRGDGTEHQPAEWTEGDRTRRKGDAMKDYAVSNNDVCYVCAKALNSAVYVSTVLPAVKFIRISRLEDPLSEQQCESRGLRKAIKVKRLSSQFEQEMRRCTKRRGAEENATVLQEKLLEIKQFGHGDSLQYLQFEYENYRESQRRVPKKRAEK